MSDQAVGFFDSGLGGLSVWQEFRKKMPFENTIYLADSKYAPYGIRKKEDIIRLSVKNTEVLMEQNCKCIIVACNTATTSAIKYLRSRYDVPFIGIEPAVKPAALQTQNNRIGVLATEGTLVSSLFLETSKKFASNIKVINQHGIGLVESIEKGDLDSLKLERKLKKMLWKMVDEGIDYLVLGCTHYPFLIPLLTKILPDSIKILDSGEAVARQAKKVLETEHLNRKLVEKSTLTVKNQFYTNKSQEIMQDFMDRINIPFSCEYMDF